MIFPFTDEETEGQRAGICPGSPKRGDTARSGDLKANSSGPAGTELLQWVSQEAGVKAGVGQGQVGFTWGKAQSLDCQSQRRREPLELMAAATRAPVLGPVAKMPVPWDTPTHPALYLVHRV